MNIWLYTYCIDSISIVEMEASNGAISTTHKTTYFEYYEDLWTMSITSDDAYIYFTVYTPGPISWF